MAQGFYLGKNPDSGARFFYDPDDLVTHAAILGMTGSGKTGLGIGLLEEAARQGIPALVLDPKGDLTNLLLHFPALRPEDFAPWVDPGEAKQKGISREALAAEKAALWKKGLAADGLGEAEIRALERVGYAVYTPGSSAGIPVSILASLAAPGPGMDLEAQADRVAATASALLGLAGFSDLDPVNDREHVLVSRILLEAWQRGEDLTLEKLILRVQRPPFSRLGVFDLEAFYPERERTALAMRLNNLLASPAFALWTRGVPLDVEKLLFDGERPRHAVFYLAHLDDAERMFFVTLLLGALEAWTLAQPGTSRLRALLYFDEVYGYLPPSRKPPSKPPLLRLLKQARAFGVGLVLATQNPVDLDYKALSNAGTWFVGRLQTPQDKDRLLDGLESLAGGADRARLDRLISGLKKRVFLAKNVHRGAPELFSTRWAMNYLAGPLGKERIPELNALVGARAEAAASPPEAPAPPEDTGLAEPPATPGWLEVYYLGEGALKPFLLAQAEYRVARRKYGLNATERACVRVPAEALVGIVPFEDFACEPREAYPETPPPRARYAPLPAVFQDARRMKGLERAFKDWVYQNARVKIFVHPELKLYGRVGEEKDAFLKRAEREAGFRAQEEVEKLKAKYRRRLDALKRRLDRERRELAEDQAELKRRKLEEVGGYLDTVMALFGGRRRALTAPLAKRRMAARAAEEVAESEAEIARLQAEIAELSEELAAEAKAIEERWKALAREVEEVELGPYKKDIALEAFGLAWAPDA